MRAGSVMSHRFPCFFVQCVHVRRICIYIYYINIYSPCTALLCMRIRRVRWMHGPDGWMGGSMDCGSWYQICPGCNSKNDNPLI